MGIGGINRMRVEKELFKDWNLACDTLKHLNQYVQNDHERLLEDNYITKEINDGRKIL
jgi:hypothetical protein